MGFGWETHCMACGYRGSILVGVGEMTCRFGEYLSRVLGRCKRCGVVQDYPQYLATYRCRCGYEADARSFLIKCPSCGKPTGVYELAQGMTCILNENPTCSQCGAPVEEIDEFPSPSPCPICKAKALQGHEILWD